MKIKGKNLISLLLIIPFFKPSSFVNYYFLDTFFDLWRVFSISVSILILAIELYKKKFFRYSNTQLFLWLFTLYVLAITIINSSSLTQWVLICLAPTCMVHLIERWRQYDYQACVSCLYSIFVFLIVSNLIVVLLKGDAGLYTDQYGSRIFFLGMRTRWPDVFFPFIGILLFYLNVRNKRNLSKIISNLIIVLTIVAIVYQVVSMWIATAIFGLFLIVLFIFLYKVFKIKFSTVKLFLSAIIFNVLITFFRIQNLFSWIIVGILHKDIGLNSRTMIWDEAISVIRDNWMFGYGITSNTSFVSLYGGSLIAQGHSLLLQLLHDAGFIGLLLFLIAILYTCKDTSKNGTNFYIAGIVIVVSIILGISEIYFYHIYVYALLALVTNIKSKKSEVKKYEIIIDNHTNL